MLDEILISMAENFTGHFFACLIETKDWGFSSVHNLSKWQWQQCLLFEKHLVPLSLKLDLENAADIWA